MNVSPNILQMGTRHSRAPTLLTLLLSIRQDLPPWLWALGSMGWAQPVCFGQQPLSSLGEQSPAPSHHAEIYQQITG